MNIKRGVTDVTHRDIHLKLLQEFRYLHLLYHRNNNQHRVARWWRYFNILKRNCSQILELTQKTILRGKKDLTKLYKLLNKFNQRLLPKLYYEFNGVIALGQFVTLGVVLVSLLSRINSVYKELNSVYSKIFREIRLKDVKTPSSLENDILKYDMNFIEPISKEELGEEIKLNEVETQVCLDPVKPKHENIMDSKKVKKKNGKKKKAKSTIDSIFG